ncbi:MAG: carbohydrate kinase [Treponema sp.]|jgi:fructokinase|nr:carbohydrate kinase [Treponema sp.]
MVICCGEALIDMVPEKNAEGRDVYVPCLGGSPYNTAVAAGRLLGKTNGKNGTAFLARLSGDFFGRELTENLERNNVSTELVTRSDQTTTLAFVKLENGQEPSYIFYTEGAADRSLVPGDLPPKLPPETTCLQFGSISMTMESSASTIESLVLRESAREDGPVISFDPNVRPMMIKNRDAYIRRFETWVKASDIVKISSADFDFIYPGAGLEKSVEKIFALGSTTGETRVNGGPRLVTVTLGADGATAFRNGTDGLRVTAPVIDLPVIDTIGAGDTFHGALLAWLEKNGRMSRKALSGLGEKELREALIFANKAASIVCSRKGANPPALAELEALLPCKAGS